MQLEEKQSRTGKSSSVFDGHDLETNIHQDNASRTAGQRLRVHSASHVQS